MVQVTDEPREARRITVNRSFASEGAVVVPLVGSSLSGGVLGTIELHIRFRNVNLYKHLGGRA